MHPLWDTATIMTSVAIKGFRIRTLQLGMGWFPEERGGVNRFYYDLLRYLPQVGVDVRGLVAGSSKVAHASGGNVQAFAPPAVPVFKRWWAVRRMVLRALAEDEISLVVSHFALYTFPVIDVIRSRPLVVHFHGPWALEAKVEVNRRLNTLIPNFVERVVYRRGTRFIVLSNAFRDVLHRHYRVPPERIRVVPGGVDVNRFTPDLTRWEARERLGLPQDRPIVLTVRRLVRRVGLEDLLAALDRVRKRVPEVLLLVVGTGPLAGALSDRVKSLGLKNNVRLLGFVPDQDLPATYRAADLTVVPSITFEGFGLVVVESLAAGTPALVTPVGGLPEVVGDLSPGLVLPATGVGPLSEGLAEVLTGGSTLPSAEACQAYARERYDWPRIAARVREVYSEALH